MSSLTLKGDPSGSGTFTVQSPNSNTSRTITLPDATTTLVGTDATQTLTNKTIQGGALTLMTSQASTSGTAIDFTGIPSWVKRVTVMFNGVSTNGTSAKQVQLGTSAGFTLSGYTSTSSGVSTAVATVSSTTGLIVYSVSTGDTLSGAMVITNVSGNIWVASFAGKPNAISSSFGGGDIILSGVLDRVRITTVNGTDTFDAGSINVLYEG